jgi:hypothetical protein
MSKTDAKTEKPEKTSALKKEAQAECEARLAAALRDNLKRRKQQARARKS